MTVVGPSGFPVAVAVTIPNTDDTVTDNVPVFVHDCSTVIASELQQLAKTHGMEERRSQSRNRLQPRHVEEFPSQSWFDRFARVICQVSVIPRKELFETWAMALYVHRTFPTANRVADLACSHGLLSWALLLLAHQDNTSRSAVCVDLNMPKSAEKIASAMIEEWPQFQDRWDYVEGPLEALQPDPSTLLVGIHACGLLSDKIVTHAIQGNAPLALVPCCHSKKSLSAEQKLQMETETPLGKTKNYSLADFIDQYRIHRLKEGGFSVQEATIPIVFTPKNRIILATPTTKRSHQPTELLPLTFNGKNPEWAKPKYCIPIADIPSARNTVRTMAGRAAATARKQDPPRSLNISLLLPVDNIQLSTQDLQGVIVDGAIIETVCPEPFWHPTEHRFARTFKVTYPQGETKQRCKELHQKLRQKIPEKFPGAHVRY